MARYVLDDGTQIYIDARSSANFPTAQPDMYAAVLKLIETENVDFERLKKDYERRQKKRKAKEAEEERKKAKWRKKHKEKEDNPLYRLRIEFWPYRHAERGRKAMLDYLDTLSTEDLRRTLKRLDALESPRFRASDKDALSAVILSRIEQRQLAPPKKERAGVLSLFRSHAPNKGDD
jgi:hypothetical protein